MVVIYVAGIWNKNFLHQNRAKQTTASRKDFLAPINRVVIIQPLMCSTLSSQPIPANPPILANQSALLLKLFLRVLMLNQSLIELSSLASEESESKRLLDVNRCHRLAKTWPLETYNYPLCKQVKEEEEERVSLKFTWPEECLYCNVVDEPSK